MSEISTSEWTSVSLVLYSTTTTAEVISSKLGTSPTRIKRKGEPVSSRSLDSPLRTQTIWSLQAPEVGTIDERVAWLLNTVGDNVADLPPDCEGMISLGLSSRPLGRLYDIEATNIGRLAQAHLRLEIDCYGHDE